LFTWGRLLNTHIPTGNLSWQQLLPQGPLPSPRAGHTATAAQGKIFIFAGGDGARIYNDLHIFDAVVNSFLTRSSLTGACPAARCAHTTTLLDANHLLVFGGGDGVRRFKDIYLLDTQNVVQMQSPSKLHSGSITHRSKPTSTPLPRNGDSCKDETKEITQWLASLGLKKYAEKFVKEEISMDLLPLLTEEHLVQMGVSTIGSRLRILSAIHTSTPNAHLRKKANTESIVQLAGATDRLCVLLSRLEERQKDCEKW